jgi:myo-inositol-1(or 4)-monophosphatase
VNAVLLLPKLREITLEAGAVAQEARKRPRRNLKPDGSIVTNGDVEVEEFLRGRLTDLIPDTGFWGEEGGYAPPKGGGIWLVDPVDGTSNYSFGSPLWGISIAWVKDGEAMLGAIYLPDLKELYLGARGAGVTCNDVPLAPIPAGPVERHELVSYGDPVMKLGKPLPGRMRCSGAFVVDATFTLRQRFRAMIGMREKLYDMAASVLFARELGADVRFADGAPLRLADLMKDEKIVRPWLIFPQGTDFLIQ